MTPTTPATPSTPAPALTGERADLLASLAEHRFWLKHTARGLTDEQAALRTTASALTIGGIIKHVTRGEIQWAGFIVDGPHWVAPPADGDYSEYLTSFQMQDGETLAVLLARYDEAAARTDDLIRSLPDLDATQPLPPAPWFEPGSRWSARRVLHHLLAETAQHAGHADIIRESLDGALSMG